MKLFGNKGDKAEATEAAVKQAEGPVEAAAETENAVEAVEGAEVSASAELAEADAVVDAATQGEAAVAAESAGKKAKPSKKAAGDWAKARVESARQTTRKKSFRLGTYTALTTVVVIIIAVVINLCVNALPSKYLSFDTTSNALYSISKETEELVGGLSQDVTLYLIVQDGQEDATIERMLENYKDLSKHLHVEKVDPVEQPMFTSQYTQEQIYNNSVIVVSGDKSRYVGYDKIYETSYSYDETGNYVQDASFNGEEVLTAAINYVTSEQTATAYVLTGHGEQNLPESLTSDLANQNIATQELRLLTEEGVPEDCKCLIIFGPTADISKKEIAKIETYLQNGGDMLLITDCLNERLDNLCKMMETYGAKLVNGMVVEGDSAHYAQGYANYLLPSVESHEITAPLIEGKYYVMAPMAQGLLLEDAAVDEDGDSAITASPLLKTSAKAYSKVEGLEASKAEKEDGDVETDDGFAVGAAITANLDNGETTNIVWYTSTYIASEQVDTLVSGGNSNLLTNTMGWLCEMEDAITIHAKALENQYLSLTAGQAGLWSMVMIFLIPLAFLITGVVIWAKRRKL